MFKNVFRRGGVLAAAVGLTMLAGAGVASAHVTANVYGAQPQKGGYGAIFFRVPNEDPDAGTVKLEIDVKPEYAVTSARLKPVPGWTSAVTRTKLADPVKTPSGTVVTEAVTAVSWTAQPGNRIAAGENEFQEFELSLGPLPSNVDTMEFPAAQTYEGGKVVNWNEPTTPGGEEPEHPAPTVKLAAATGGDGDSGASMAGMSSDQAAPAAPASTGDGTARWLGGAGLVVGALGLGVGAGAILRGRRRPAQPDETGTSS